MKNAHCACQTTRGPTKRNQKCCFFVDALFPARVVVVGHRGRTALPFVLSPHVIRLGPKAMVFFFGSCSGPSTHTRTSRSPTTRHGRVPTKKQRQMMPRGPVVSQSKHDDTMAAEAFVVAECIVPFVFELFFFGSFIFFSWRRVVACYTVECRGSLTLYSF